MRTCKMCSVEKDASLFYPRKTGVNNVCKKCFGIRTKEWRKTDNAKLLTKISSKAWRLKNKHRFPTSRSRSIRIKCQYGITEEQYDLMFKEQNGACKICLKQDLNGKRLPIDHDHKTGKVRGLLCFQCNAGLGHFKDDPELMEKAIWYLYQSVQRNLING